MEYRTLADSKAQFDAELATLASRNLNPRQYAKEKARLEKNYSSRNSKIRSRTTARSSSSTMEGRSSSRPRTETQKKKDGKAKVEADPAPSGPTRWHQEGIKSSDFMSPAPPQLGAPSQHMGVNYYQPVVAMNKPGVRYTPAIADPNFPFSQFYHKTELAPFGPALNFSDRSQSSLISEDGLIMTNPKGWTSAKGNCCAREGRYYYEVTILVGPPSKQVVPDYLAPHVRVGYGRREADLELSVGNDAYSYGLRDTSGDVYHTSRPRPLFPKEENGFKEGDVLGLEIFLPSFKLHHKIVDGSYNQAVDLVDDDDAMTGGAEADDIVRDRFTRRLKGQLVNETIDYVQDKELHDTFHQFAPTYTERGITAIPPGPSHPLVPFRTLPGSYIHVYKNGRSMGQAYKDELLAFLPPASHPDPSNQNARQGLDDGMLGYYPMVSAIGGGSVKVNFGPKFAFPPPGYVNENEDVDMAGGVEKSQGPKEKTRALSDRYDEQIAEDVVYDILDEVDFMNQGHPSASIGGTGAATSSTIPASHRRNATTEE